MSWTQKKASLLFLPLRYSHPLLHLKLRQLNIDSSQRTSYLLRWTQIVNSLLLPQPLPQVQSHRRHYPSPQVQRKTQNSPSYAITTSQLTKITSQLTKITTSQVPKTRERVVDCPGRQAGVSFRARSHDDRPADCLRHLRQLNFQTSLHFSHPQRGPPARNRVLLLLCGHHSQRRPGRGHDHHRSQKSQPADP